MVRGDPRQVLGSPGPWVPGPWAWGARTHGAWGQGPIPVPWIQGPQGGTDSQACGGSLGPWAWDPKAPKPRGPPGAPRAQRSRAPGAKGRLGKVRVELREKIGSPGG